MINILKHFKCWGIKTAPTQVNNNKLPPGYAIMKSNLGRYAWRDGSGYRSCSEHNEIDHAIKDAWRFYETQCIEKSTVWTKVEL